MSGVQVRETYRCLTGVMRVKYFSKKFPYSKLLARHVEAYHLEVDGLRCSFEQCTVKSKRLEEIRNHVRQAHSVKNPIMGSHFSNECADNAGHEDTDEQEKDLAAIYDCLDQQIDFDVLNDNAKTPESGDVIKEEDPLEEDAESPPSVMESSGEVSKPEASSSSTSSGRPSRKRKRPQTKSPEKLVVKIQSKRMKRKAMKTAETASTEVVSDPDIKDEPADHD